MKCFFIFLGVVLLVGLGITACGVTWTANVTSNSGSGPCITGSGNLATENRTVGNFTGLKLDSVTDTEVTIGPTTSVVVTADDNLLPIIDTIVENGGTLHITTHQSFSTKQSIKVKITTPSLDSVNLAGAGSLRVTGLDSKNFSLDVSGVGGSHLSGKADNFEIHLSGAGGVNVDELQAKNVQISLSGVGGVKLHGQADKLEAHLSGAGSLNAKDLPANLVTVNVSGVGGASVNATQTLDATVSGVGGVSYTGHPPEVHKNVSGIGSVHAD